jgi:hypothetical protein
MESQLLEMNAALTEAQIELKLANDDLERLLDTGDASWEECQRALDVQEKAMALAKQRCAEAVELMA